MKKNIKKAIKWLKKAHTSEYNVRGCITGSCLLGYFEGQDVDLFVYDEASLRNIFYKMYHDKMFNILNPLEKWKFEEYINSPWDKKPPIYTVKFVYNTCLDVNIIYKKKATNIYGVLSSFDMDIVCKGYDLETKQLLDLTDGAVERGIASWNKYNTDFYNPKIWEASKLLRQIGRCIKYYKRGYNTDEVCIKLLELADGVLKHQNIFKSPTFEEKLKLLKKNIKVVKKIGQVWLETHEMTEEQEEILNNKLKEI